MKEYGFVHPRHSEVEWREIVEKQKGSNQSLEEYCEVMGVSQGQFEKWRKRFCRKPLSDFVELGPVRVEGKVCVELDLGVGRVLRVFQ